MTGAISETRTVALVADDHALFRRAIGSLLQKDCDIDKIVEVENFDQALIFLEEQPDTCLAVLDLFMPGIESASQLRSIRVRFPSVRLVVLSGSGNRQDILDVLAAGAHGFIRKTASPEQTKSALHEIMRGSIYIPPDVAEPECKTSRTDYKQSEEIKILTPRQLEVVGKLRIGLSNKQIARELGLTENTVKVHLNACYRALGVRGRRQILLTTED